MAGCADNPGVLFRPGRVLALVLAVLLIGAVVVLFALATILSNCFRSVDMFKINPPLVSRDPKFEGGGLS